MLKTLIAGLTALSLSIVPAPATAFSLNDDDIAKLVLGLIALGAVTSALDDDAETADRAEHDQRPRFGTEMRDRGGFVPPRGPGNNNGRFGSDNRVLPRSCLRNVETRYGTHRIFGRHCLQQEYAGFDRLPNRCAVRLVYEHGVRRGFDPACLRERGYTARR